MEKLLRKTKRTGRCNLHGYGNCEVSLDISSIVVSRTEEKRKINKLINEGVKFFDEDIHKITQEII